MRKYGNKDFRRPMGASVTKQGSLKERDAISLTERFGKSLYKNSSKLVQVANSNRFGGLLMPSFLITYLHGTKKKSKNL
jgi:hypothetical protein